MPPATPSPAERAPRRARYLIPRDFPRRSEAIAVAAMLVLAAHLSLAPLTIALAAVFHAVSRAVRWRPQWLLAPAGAGLAWALAAGPGSALAGFAARPRAVTAALAGVAAGPAGPAQLAAAISPLRWLPGQLPVALAAAAAEAAAAWWLWWLHTDEWQLPAARPGLVTLARRCWHGAVIRSGGVVTPDGACLGLDRRTGRPVAVSWREAETGVLVTGESWDAVSAAGWQLAHAAVRRRKPVIAVDLAGDPALAAGLAAACAAAEAPLQVFGAAGPGYYEPFQSGSPARKASLVMGMIEWAGTAEAGRRGMAAVLADVFAVAAAAPAGSHVPVLDDVVSLLAAPALRARLDRVPAYHPRRASLADRVAASAHRLDSEPALAGLVAGQLSGLRASPPGRWLCPGPPDGGGSAGEQSAAAARISLERVVRDRGVALFSLAGPAPGGLAPGQGPGTGAARPAEMIASLVALDAAGVYAGLRRDGIAADGLAWFGRCEALPPGMLAGLAAAGPQAGLGCVFVTTSAPAAAALAGCAGVLAVHRLADPALAAQLAPRTGTRLVPAGDPALAAVPAAGAAPAAVPAMAAGPPPAGPLPAGTVAAGTAVTGLPAAGGPVRWDPSGTARAPVVPAWQLCELPDREFTLIAGSPRARVIPRCEAVTGRVPRHRPVRAGRLARLARPAGQPS